MKTKDAGFIQKHVEKVVLGAGALFLLVIAAYIFIGNPYAVEVSGERVSPREAEARLLTQANQLEQRLRADDGLEATISQRDIPSYAGDFRERIFQQVIGVDRYAIALNMPGLGEGTLAEREAPDPFYVPRPQIPDEPIARASYGVLGEVEDRNVQERLNRFMVDNQTRDFRAVSVSAEFDMDAFARRLQSQAPPGYQQLPEGWWRAMNGIAGVYLQREERDPVTGEWGNRQIIDPLPTQVAYGAEGENRRWDVEEADRAVARIRQNQMRIIQPEFVPMVGPTVWLPPDQSPRELSGEEQRELNRINEQIQTIQNRIDGWERTLRRQGHETPSEQLERGRRIDFDQADPQRGAQQQRDARARQQQQRQQRGMNEFDDMGFEDPRDNRRDRQRQQQDRGRSDEEPRLYRQVVTEMGRIRDLERQRDELYGITRDDDDRDRRGRQQQQWQDDAMFGEFDDFGEFGEFGPGMDPRGGDPRGNQRRGRDAGEALSGEIQVWAHDLTAEPGRTYRYRVIVTVLNPLFQQRRLHPEQQEEYFNRIALWPEQDELESAEASNWSSPVTLDPEHYFFLVEGSPSREEAKVEVWRLFRGQWHFEEFDVRPGDIIGGETRIDGQTVSMRVDAMLVDLVSVSEGTSSGSGARMIYMDQETNLIGERVADEDRDSDHRIRLRNELDRTAELADRSAGR
ncbi:hypothetical protein ACERK3_00855 [Phycisphaerales bacterium AB-hyl4]|uniref:Uncharacterized protein n=1 Tax=Natronomicrosphaera hydrolytica TaxID=3242702 RepID=A0ABV4U0Y1_9BACT